MSAFTLASGPSTPGPEDQSEDWLLVERLPLEPSSPKRLPFERLPFKRLPLERLPLERPPLERLTLQRLPLELQFLIYDHVLADTAPRIFEVRYPETASQGALHVVPARALRPPPIFHAIPQARRYLLPQFLTSFTIGRVKRDRHGQQQQEDARRSTRGWLFHPLIDFLLLNHSAATVLMSPDVSIRGVTNVLFRPTPLSYYRSCAMGLLHGFPDLQSVTLCDVSAEEMREEGVSWAREVPQPPGHRQPHRLLCERFARALDQEGRELRRTRPILVDWLVVQKPPPGPWENLVDSLELILGDERTRY